MRAYTLKAWVPALLALGLMGCSVTSNPADADADLLNKDAADQGLTDSGCLTPEDMDRMSDQLFQLINLERTSMGLPPVVRSNGLDRLAGDYACKMVRDGFFSHYDPENGTGPGARATRANYRYYFIGENLAAGQLTAADTMRELMDSPDHRNIILSDKWTDVGLGVRAGGEHGIYWVMEFADPWKPAPTPVAPPPPGQLAVADAGKPVQP